MKKLVTLCAFTFAFSFMYATDIVLADFENPDNDVLTVGSKWYEPERFIVEPSIGDNDAKSGLNTSNKVFKAVNVADADWWGNFASLDFKTPITITESNRYLKFLAYRSIQPKDLRICVNEGDSREHEEAWQVYYGKLSSDATWEGIVADLGANWMGKTITSIVFIWSTNWNDPRSGWSSATYMFDNFVLSDNMIPAGVTEITNLSGFNIGFENTTQTNEWITKFDILNETNTYEVANNPVAASETNTTAKVVKFNKSADASWWQGLRMEFKGALKVSADYKYLHTMVYVPDVVFETVDEIGAGIDVQLCAKDFTGKEETYIETIYDDYQDWMDIVMPINTLTHISELTVRFDLRKDGEEWKNSPANTFYFDEVTLDDNPDQRINTSVKTMDALPHVNVFSVSEKIVVDNLTSGKASVYSATGSLVRSAVVEGKTEISVPKGFYIVKIESEKKTKTLKITVK